MRHTCILCGKPKAMIELVIFELHQPTERWQVHKKCWEEIKERGKAGKLIK